MRKRSLGIAAVSRSTEIIPYLISNSLQPLRFSAA